MYNISTLQLPLVIRNYRPHKEKNKHVCLRSADQRQPQQTERSSEDKPGEHNREQVQVQQQDEGESCGYRMLSNLSKAIRGQETQQERAKDRNRLYTITWAGRYKIFFLLHSCDKILYLEIAQTLKDQIKRNKEGKGKQEKREKKGEG